MVDTSVKHDGLVADHDTACGYNAPIGDTLTIAFHVHLPTQLYRQVRIALRWVTLTVTVNRAAEPVVNNSGNQITSFSALQQAQSKITLLRGTDGKWRFCTITPVTGTSSKPISLL